MENLNLKRLWEICEQLSSISYNEEEKGNFVYLLGNLSQYDEMTFEHFLDYCSFKIEEEHVVVYNNDSVAYESFTVGDFSRIPISLLSFSGEEILNWANTEIEKQLAQQKTEKEKRKEYLKGEIIRLEKELKTL